MSGERFERKGFEVRKRSPVVDQVFIEYGSAYYMNRIETLSGADQRVLGRKIQIFSLRCSRFKHFRKETL